ncbi:hypothetical protein V2J09_008602 [Rumex salicifolius]
MPSGPTKYLALHPHLPLNYKLHLSKETEAMITKKRLVHLLVLILTCMSVFRLLRLAITTFPPLKRYCNPLDPECHSFSLHFNETISFPIPTLTIKELKFLTNLVTQKAPCNLLIFGLEPEYFILSKINSEGRTFILEDNPEKLRLFQRRSNNTRIHKVEYTIPAKDAYKVLKTARKKPSCSPCSYPLESSKCRLALTALPEEVYKIKWDVIIVDGPSGDRPDTPGRMATIYTASVLARAENGTNVVVHDVDRVIERWFSWEFLCEDNLVSSKGKFWNFLIEGGSEETYNALEIQIINAAIKC